MGAPKARCSPELRMFEPLLLANPDSKTLRPVRSRASTGAPQTRTASRTLMGAVLRGLAAWSAWLARLLCWFTGSREFAALFLGGSTVWSERLPSWVTALRIFAASFSGG